MFLVYLPALCHRRVECFTKTEQQTIPCSRLRKRLLHFDRLFYSIASSLSYYLFTNKIVGFGKLSLESHLLCCAGKCLVIMIMRYIAIIYFLNT